jgi:N-acetylglutamate synthase-like GNAT family acetyltransferase
MSTRWNRDLTTHTGFTFHVRTARAEDEAALHDFFATVTPEDLRFRFLSTVKDVGHDRLVAMTKVDHRHNESFVALEREDGPIIGAAMLACDDKLETGEVAVSISRDFKNRGIGWELLAHVTRYAQAIGVKRLQSLEDRANAAAIRLEGEMGFTSRAYPGEPGLVVLEKSLATLA